MQPKDLILDRVLTSMRDEVSRWTFDNGFSSWRACKRDDGLRVTVHYGDELWGHSIRFATVRIDEDTVWFYKKDAKALNVRQDKLRQSLYDRGLERLSQKLA